MCWRQALSIVSVCAALAGCAHVQNLPANLPTATPLGESLDALADLPDDDVMIGLAFSGGGTRAAAFSFGVLKELARTELPSGRGRTLLEKVDIVTGVSGGSVTAAYFGLRRRAALDDFRERFLVQDAEAALNTAVSFGNIAKAFGGGVNGDAPFRQWLDANLFDGATFGALLSRRRPQVVINASDIYNRTPFVFTPSTFAAMCSDLARYPLSSAVAASAAVPLAFAPVVLETFPDKCDAPLPAWMKRARDDPAASPMMKAVARGMTRYRDGSMRYIKLVDGGVVDNFGLSSFTVAREAANTPYGPLTAAHAARIRRILFIVVDSEQVTEGNWAQTLDGPTGVELIGAAANAALASSVWSSYSAFQLSLQQWRSQLVRWRCGLPAAEVQRLRGTTAGWNCRDLDGFIGRVAFDQFDPARSASLNAIPTRFRLPVEQVDALIAAGGDALAQHPAFRDFLRSLRVAPRTVAAAEPAITAARPIAVEGR